MGENTLKARRPRVHEHAPLLAECGAWIGEELQPELAEHDVEGVVSERELESADLVPSDGGTGNRRKRSRYGEHSDVDVDSRDLSGHADTDGRFTRDHPGATGDIEHPLTGTGGNPLDEVVRPLRGHRRNQAALVELSRRARELPLPLPLVAPHPRRA